MIVPVTGTVAGPVAGRAGAGSTPLLECRGLVKRYGATRALDRLDLVVEPGGPVALVGPNGAGKTTLFSVLCGFLPARAGTVRVLGHPPGHPALRGRLAALPQDAALDPHADVGVQLRGFARLQGHSRAGAAKEAARVLERVDLAGSARSRPGALSHGMRKRVALAQALIGAPELVLLDEPTAGVDPPNVRIIHAIVRELADTTGFLISSHNLDELERLTERVVYLERGRVSERGERAVAALDETGRLGLVLVDVDVAAATSALAALPGVRAVDRAEGGDFALSVDDADAAAATVLGLCAERGWRWRSLTRGRSLEQRLYED